MLPEWICVFCASKNESANWVSRYFLSTQLSIKNLAITDSLELDFNAGLSVLTGETGAGKSIIIDAIGLVLGDRAEPGMIKSGAKRADIIASFDIQKLPQIQNWLIEHEFDDIEDDIHECILKRSLQDTGRSKGYINAQAVPLNLLKQLGEDTIRIMTPENPAERGCQLSPRKAWFYDLSFNHLPGG